MKYKVNPFISCPILDLSSIQGIDHVGEVKAT